MYVYVYVEAKKKRGHARIYGIHVQSGKNTNHPLRPLPAHGKWKQPSSIKGIADQSQRGEFSERTK